MDDDIMSFPGSPDDQPETKHMKFDDDMLDGLEEFDRRILAASIPGVDITAVYSPERIAKVAKKFGLQAGSSFDLTKRWDFNIEEHRKKAWAKIKEESPYLLIGSPPFMYSSMLQGLDVAVHGHKPDWIAKSIRKRGRLPSMSSSVVDSTSTSSGKEGISCKSISGQPVLGPCHACRR